MPAPLTTAREAEADLRAAGYTPLEPYPMRVVRPWKVRCTTCGHERTLNLNRVRNGLRCSHPSLRSEPAERELRALGYEPMEPYPGRADVRWAMRCTACKKPRHTPLRYLQARARPCGCEAKRKAAEALLRGAGYTPLDPYPGASRNPWRSQCTSCGAERRPSLDTIKQGKRCEHEQTARTAFTPAEAAVAQARAAGYEPVEPYPGLTNRPWRMRCTTCGLVRRPKLAVIRAGRTCAHKSEELTSAQAAAELRAAGYEPLAPYPGNVLKSWPSTCTFCGRPRNPSLVRIRQGARCKHVYS